jgi:hypothetical protein
MSYKQGVPTVGLRVMQVSALWHFLTTIFKGVKQMLMNKEEQKKIARIVNALIDIPLVPEEMEQTVFEHAVGLVDQALEDVLPAAFEELLRNAEKGIDKDHARQFGNRLVEAVNQKVNLPYLNEEQEFRLLQTVIDPLVKAMISGKKLDDLLPAVE